MLGMLSRKKSTIAMSNVHRTCMYPPPHLYGFVCVLSLSKLQKSNLNFSSVAASALEWVSIGPWLVQEQSECQLADQQKSACSRCTVLTLTGQHRVQSSTVEWNQHPPPVDHHATVTIWFHLPVASSQIMQWNTTDQAVTRCQMPKEKPLTQLLGIALQLNNSIMRGLANLRNLILLPKSAFTITPTLSTFTQMGDNSLQETLTLGFV